MSCRFRFFRGRLIWFWQRRSGRAVNIRRTFLAPLDARNIVDLTQLAATSHVDGTRRWFGYNNLVVDMRSFRHERVGVPVVFDVTHSRNYRRTRMQLADSRYIEPLARAGACGVDAVFMEVHECPERALSDGPNALPLERLEALLLTLRDIHQLVGNGSV